MRNELVRQADIIPEEILAQPITIIGCGAVGSFAALSLGKMGFQNMHIIDNDTVETVNMNAQFFPTPMIGKLKAKALEELLMSYAGFAPTVKTEKYDGEIFLDNIVISAVDNMETRSKAWHANRMKAEFFIDPRMSGEYIRLFAMNSRDPKDWKTYEKTLYSDSDAVEERCTAKSTIYTVLLISGLICKIVKDVLTFKDYYRVVDWDVNINRLMAWGKNGQKLC